MNEELKKYSEITDLNFDGEDPHLAICHELQNYSANGRTDIVIQKGSLKGGTEIVKSMDGVLPEVVIQKMSMDNKRKALNEAIEERIRSGMSANGDYVWVYISDFNEDMAVFRYQEDFFAVPYEITEEGIVTLVDDPKEVRLRDVYIDADTGEELVKAARWSMIKNPKDIADNKSESEGVVTGEESDNTPKDKNHNTEENPMSDQNVDLQEVLKSDAGQEAIEKAALAIAEAKAEEKFKAMQAEREQQELEKSTVEILKSVEAIDEETAKVITKSVLAGADSQVILKAFTDMQDLLVKATKEKEEAIEKADEVKDKFGGQDSLEGEAKDKIEKSDKKAALSEWVKANKAK